MPRVFAAPAALAASWAHAHPGHAAPTASHGHATDVLGFLLAGAVAMAIMWLARGKK